MSAGVALQDLVYATLIADASVSNLVGGRIYDNPPEHPDYPYVSFGPADFVEEDVECITVEDHTLQIDVWTRERGSLRGTKDINAAIKSALHEKPLVMPDPHYLVQIRVPRGRAIPDRADNVGHGIMTVEATIEIHD